MTVEFNDPGADSPWKVTVDWGHSGPASTETFDSVGRSFSLSHAYPDNGVFTAKVTVDDGDGGTCEATFTVTVDNLAPTLTINGPATIDEGKTWSGSGTATDVPADTVSGSVTYGDGASAALVIGADGKFDLSHVYADGPNNYTVTVTVNDEDGGSTVKTIAVRVDNLAPTLTINGPATIDEGKTWSGSGTATDVPADTVSGSVTYGDGASAALVIGADGKFDLATSTPTAPTTTPSRSPSTTRTAAAP